MMQGLYHADWELERGLMRDKEGREISSPVNWVFASLAKFGYYRRPEHYVSPEEQAKLDAEAEAKRLLEANRRAREAQFEAWKAGLGEEGRKAILAAKRRPGPDDAFLRVHWEKQGQS